VRIVNGRSDERAYVEERERLRGLVERSSVPADEGFSMSVDQVVELVAKELSTPS
jgi:hypothetical protein